LQFTIGAQGDPVAFAAITFLSEDFADSMPKHSTLNVCRSLESEGKGWCRRSNTHSSHLEVA